MRTLAASFLIVIVGVTHPLAQAVQTVDEFCSDLSALNSHLTSNFSAYFNTSFPTPFECVCETTEPETLVVDCVGVYDNIDALETSREQAILTADDGTFTLAQTAWSDTFYDSIDIFQGIYVFQDGEQVSCTTTGCASCSICSDGASIQVDCSTLPAGFEYTTECSEQYMGAFISSFAFPVITTGPAVSPIAGPVGSLPPAAEDFCADLSDLEAHMKSSFEETVFTLPAENMYECECSTPFDASMLSDCTTRYGEDVCNSPDDFALIIDCSMSYFDGTTYINFEQAIFEKSSNDSRLDLWRTGWGDTTISIGFHEFFFFENGSLNECFRRTISEFGVCAVCPDGENLSFCNDDLATSCDITCSDMYTGAFFNTYDFALLAAPMDTVSTTMNPMVAPTGSPITAGAPPTDSPVVADAPTANADSTLVPVAPIPSTMSPVTMPTPTDSTPAPVAATPVSRQRAKVSGVTVIFSQVQRMDEASVIGFQNIVASWSDAYFNESRQGKLQGVPGITNMRTQIDVIQQTVTSISNTVTFTQTLGYDAVAPVSSVASLVLAPWMDSAYSDQLADQLKQELPDACGKLVTPITVPVVVDSEPVSSDDKSSSNGAYYGLVALVLIPIVGFVYLAYRKQSKQTRQQETREQEQEQEIHETNQEVQPPHGDAEAVNQELRPPRDIAEAVADTVINSDELPDAKDQCRTVEKNRRGEDLPMATALPLDYEDKDQAEA